jgi:hypothetical protein
MWDMDARLAGRIQEFCDGEPDLFLDPLRIEEVIRDGHDCYLFLKATDRRSPGLLLVTGAGNGVPERIIPFFLVREHEDRQIVSYLLGRRLCNLAPVREISGRLYSRSARTYEADELVHDDGPRSRIALWVHDCLTEDFDHGRTLNRAELRSGAAVSFDFGMSFSGGWFPPFFAWELGLSDETIAGHAPFVVDLLARYSRLVCADEDEIVSGIREAYPTTHREGLCRYYLRNFAAYFPLRLYYGRFFQKLMGTPLDRPVRAGVEAIAGRIGLDLGGAAGWDDLIVRLVKLERGRLDLRGLDLSGASLTRADLLGADLRGCDLAGADLTRADLRGADLRGARTEGVTLMGARTDGMLS